MNKRSTNHRCFENDTSGCAVFPRSVAAVRFGESEVKLMGFGFQVGVGNVGAELRI